MVTKGRFLCRLIMCAYHMLARLETKTQRTGQKKTVYFLLSCNENTEICRRVIKIDHIRHHEQVLNQKLLFILGLFFTPFPSVISFFPFSLLPFCRPYVFAMKCSPQSQLGVCGSAVSRGQENAFCCKEPRKHV